MIVPAAAGGVAVVALTEIALAIAIFAAGMLAFALLAWILTHAEQAARALPFVGGQVAGIVHNIYLTTYVLAQAIEFQMQIQIANMHHWYRILVNAFMAPVIMPIYYSLNGIFNTTYWLSNTWRPFIEATIGFVEDWLKFLNASLTWVRDVEFPRAWEAIRGAWDVLAVHAAAINLILYQHIPAIWDGINGLRADLVLVITAVRELQAYLPVLRRLAEFEAEAVRGIEGVAGRVGALERAETDLARDLAKVLPLAIVVAVGLAGVRNLERLARDPCHCLTLGDFSDLPSRVEALEELGP